MKDRLELALYVLLNAPKAYWALALSILFPLIILMIGDHMIDNLEFHGVMKGLEDSIGHRLMRRYDRLAFVTMIGLWVIAYKAYRKAWKRLLS